MPCLCIVWPSQALVFGLVGEISRHLCKNICQNIFDVACVPCLCIHVLKFAMFFALPRSLPSHYLLVTSYFVHVGFVLGCDLTLRWDQRNAFATAFLNCPRCKYGEKRERVAAVFFYSVAHMVRRVDYNRQSNVYMWPFCQPVTSIWNPQKHPGPARGMAKTA